ncbi:MAG: penicillin-binding protein 1C [Gammaproteobacteria bacterium]
MKAPRGRLRRLLWAGSVVVITASLVLTVIRYWPRAPLSARIPSSVAVLDANGELLRLTAAADQQYRLWTPLDKVSPVFLEALLLHEDKDFYTHSGVDASAIVRAAIADVRGGRQGASTLTMQLARLLYGLNTRSVTGKLQQMALAIGLELRYSKRELLEAHVNLLPYGGNVQGIGAATRIYFAKAPADLTLAECLTLVVIPQSPASRAPRRQPSLRSPAMQRSRTDSHPSRPAFEGSPSPSRPAPESSPSPSRPAIEGSFEPQSLKNARSRLYTRWQTLHPTSADQAGLITLSLHYGTTTTLPFQAPHLTTALLSRTPNATIIQTTLNIHRQRILERILQSFVREHERIGVNNAAALLVDSRDLSIQASVGSAQFFNAAISGQVNGTLAKRSPGSALKPFIYALAIDQGLIHPLTVLTDAPTSFGTFTPENFDGQFAGPISATGALVRSRNIPAVTLSARLDSPSFYQFLRGAGISKMASESHYGLALALGGGEVTMEETAVLYAMLANRGVLRPLRYSPDQPLATGTRLLSDEASFMTLQMLSQNPRPGESSVEPVGRLPVAWKTGTSWGFRDAWSAGVFGPYVLVVWVGNFDGSSNPAFVGAQTAAPLFFRIVDALHAAEPGLRELPYRLPAHVVRVEVCAASGDLPNAECPRTALTWFIPGKSPIRVSSVHRRVWVDTRTGLQACAPFDPEFVRSEVFEFWPSDLQLLFAQAGMPRRKPPAAAPCSQDAWGGTPPHIRSPLSNATYTLRAGSMSRDTIPLAATADAEVRTLHWFVDDTYVGTSPPNATVTWAPGRTGAFFVRTVDDRGRADSRELRVVAVQ